MCYVSLEFPALKVRQGSTLIAHKGAIFFSLKMPINLTQYRGTTGVFNASIIMIKIKNRPRSRLYYFCKTEQVSKIFNFFWYCYFLFCYSISVKRIQNLYWSITTLCSLLAVQIKNITERGY